MESDTLKRIIAGVVGVAALAIAFLFWRGDTVAPPERVNVLVPDNVRIKVEVFNASGQRGWARLATFALRDAGFDVVRYGNDPPPHQDTTVVIARSGRDDWAQLVARALGGARIESRPDSSRYLDITVLLGSTWRPPSKPFHP
jgi:hypothetical protein